MNGSHFLAEGRVRHRRRSPAHDFRYRVGLVDLDLERLDSALRGPFRGVSRFAWTRFRREDYLEPHAIPLEEAARRAAERILGKRPRGRVRLVTHLRQLGYSFNPVSFYLFVDEQSCALEAVLAEITNTPWGERHQYALEGGSSPGSTVRASLPKRFHVSPFFGMDHEYDWQFRIQGDALVVRMKNSSGGRTVFEASLALRRSPWTLLNRLKLGLVHPWLTWRVHLAIYWQALRLWRKKARFHAHPSKPRGSRRRDRPRHGEPIPPGSTGSAGGGSSNGSRRSNTAA